MEWGSHALLTWPPRSVPSAPVVVEATEAVLAVLTFSSDALQIRPWPDEVIDTLGFDARSAYVETYWLGILGPSTTWLLRRLVAGLDAAPEGFVLPLAETARQLGLGDRGGRHSPFLRAVTRTIQFELAEPRGDAILAVRRRVPPLNRRQVLRLSPALQEAHRRWQESQLRTARPRPAPGGPPQDLAAPDPAVAAHPAGARVNRWPLAAGPT